MDGIETYNSGHPLRHFSISYVSSLTCLTAVRVFSQRDAIVADFPGFTAPLPVPHRSIGLRIPWIVVNAACRRAALGRRE